jgi:chromate transport protein ChrA
VLVVASYVLPGAVVIFLLTLFTAGTERSPWLDGALRGAGLGALGLLVSATVNNVGPARAARFGLGIALLAETAAAGGGTTGYLLGVLFVALGFGRIYLLRRR